MGNNIGRFLEYDESYNVGLWRLYMRIRVLVDVKVALKKTGRKMESGPSSPLNMRG